MRIIFFIDNLGVGGKERRFVELIKGVKSQSNFEFEIVTMSDDVHYKQLFELNIKIHYLIRKSKKEIAVFRRFYSICKNYQPDFVHCWDSMTAIIAVPTCKLLNIKLINGMVIDTPVIRNIFNKNWLRAKLSFPFSTRVIGNSKAGLEAYGAPVNKSTCVYNGMDLNRFINLLKPELVKDQIFANETKELFIGGMVAAFHDRKDYKTLIKAALALCAKYDNVRFLLIGTGDNYDGVKEMVPENYKDKIIFLGKRLDIESLVNIFDVGILLTNSKVHGEGISNSIIEYMALAKPVIATYGGGTNEVVIDGENGYLISPGNINQLIEKMEILIKDKKRVKDLGMVGNKMVLEKFDSRMMTDKYINIYNSLL